MPTLIEMVIEKLKSPYNTFPMKELLLIKLEGKTDFNDAYLTNEEKVEVNRIFKLLKLPMSFAVDLEAVYSFD